MSIGSWISQLFRSDARGTKSSKPQKRILEVEALEERRVPAGNVAFADLGVGIADRIDLPGVEVSTGPVFRIARGLGGGLGLNDSRVGTGETVLFRFDAPATGVSFANHVIGNGDFDGFHGEARLEAFGANGRSLGTVDVNGAGHDVSALFGGVPLLAFTVSPVESDDLAIGSVTSSVTGAVDLTSSPGITDRLDLPGVEVSAGPIFHITRGLGGGLGVDGFRVSTGETVLFRFDAPATDVSFANHAIGNGDFDGFHGEARLEAFGADGRSLGTVEVNGAGHDVSALFGDVPLLAFTVSPVESDDLAIGSVTSSVTGAVDLTSFPGVTDRLDLPGVVLSAGSVLRTTSGLLGGLGVDGTRVDTGESVLFRFDAPATGVSFENQVIGNGDFDGFHGEARVEAFRADGRSLGTVDVEGFGPHDVSALFGGVPLSAFTVSPIDTDSLSIIELTFDIDQPPTSPADADSAVNAVSGGAATGTRVGITANAISHCPPVSYRLIDDAGGRFAIDSSTGVITVADGSLLDFATDRQHSIMVEARDDSGRTNNSTFTIRVRPNEVYVDDDFSNPVPGEDPDGAGPATEFGVDAFSTIQEGLDFVGSGGIVHVNPGTYPESLLINRSVTLGGTSDTPGAIVIDPASGNGITVTDGEVILRDLTVRDAATGIHQSGSGNLTLSNVQVVNNAEHGISTESTGAIEFTTVTVTGNGISGAQIRNAASFSDVDGFYSNNVFDGIRLLGIAGDASLTRTVLEDNDGNGDFDGAGLRVDSDQELPFTRITGLTVGADNRLFVGAGNDLYSVPTDLSSPQFLGFLDHTSEGLTFDGTNLLSVARRDNLLRTVDPTDGSTLSSVELTLPGQTVLSAEGLAVHPVTGELFGLLVLEGQDTTELVTINPTTGEATSIGDLGDIFEDIEFDADGKLYATTSSLLAARVPDTLFTVSTADASVSAILSLHRGDSGEVLAFHPGEGVLFGASSSSRKVLFKVIDPTVPEARAVNIAIGGDLTISGAQFRGTDGAEGTPRQQQGVLTDGFVDGEFRVETTDIIGHQGTGIDIRGASSLTIQGGRVAENGIGINLRDVSLAQFRDVTVEQNRRDGAEILRSGDVFIDGSSFVDNQTHGVDFNRFDNLTVTDSRFLNNSVNGLSIADRRGELIIDNVVVSGQGTDGIGDRNSSAFSGGVLISNATIENNQTGGIDVTDATSLHIRRSRVSGTDSVASIRVLDIAGSVTIEETTVVDNGREGVRVVNAGAFHDIDGVYANNADHGISLRNIAGDVTLTRTILEANNANDDTFGDGLNVGASFSLNQIQGLAFGPGNAQFLTNGVILSEVDSSFEFSGGQSTLDHVSDALVFLGADLLSAGSSENLLRTVETFTGDTRSSVEVTLANETVVGIEGLAVHPTTGVLFALLVLDGQATSELVTINPTTGEATRIGDTGLRFDDITFDDNGILYGIPESGPSSSDALFTISTTDASATVVVGVSLGQGGSAIAFNPEDGLIHFGTSNGPSVRFQSIDPSTGEILLLNASIGGDLIISGARIRGLGELGSAAQRHGIFVREAVAGAIRFEESNGIALEVSGHQFEGVEINGSTSFTAVGGLFFGNDRGISLNLVGSASLTEVNAEQNRQVALQISNTGELTIEQSSVLRNNGLGVSLVDVESTNIASTQIDGNGLAGIQIEDSTLVTVSGSTVSNNQRGITALTSSLDVINSTISGNRNPEDGAGIHFAGFDLNVFNSTITNNLVDSGGNGTVNGGGIFLANSTSAVVNSSIIAGNVRREGASVIASDLSGDFNPASSFNLIGSGEGSTGIVDGINNNQVGTTNSPIDPQLAPLGDKGGPTQTHALLLGSPALNAGSNPLGLSSDQRGQGFPRTLESATDIGAFELAINAAPIANAQSVSTPEDTPLSITLTAEDGDPEVVQTLSYTITDGPSNGLITGFNPTTGEVIYTPNLNYFGSDSFTFTVTDDITAGQFPLTSTPTTVSIDVTSVNDFPTLNGFSSAPIAVEGGGPVLLDSDVTINDVEQNWGRGILTVSGLTPGDRVAVRSNGDRISVTGSEISVDGRVIATFVGGAGANLSITFNADAENSDVETVIENLVFENDSEAPLAQRVLLLNLEDGAGDPTNTELINAQVIGINDAPVNTVPATQILNQNTELIFFGANGNLLSVADPDAGSNVITTTLSVESGSLFARTAGSADITANGSGRVTIAGTLSEVNAALAQVTYRPDAHFSGVDTLIVLTNDNGNTGIGGAFTDVDSVTLVVNGGPEVLDLDGAPIFLQSGSPVLIDGDVTILDSEQNWEGGALTVTGTLQGDRIDVRGNGLLRVSRDEITLNGTVIATILVENHSDLTITFNEAATNSDVEAVIENLEFSSFANPLNPERELTLELRDGGGISAGPFSITVRVVETPTIGFTSSQYFESEGDATRIGDIVTLRRSGTTLVASSVEVFLSNSSAIAGEDFSPGPITVHFAVGETAKVVPIEILGDTSVERNEQFSLTLGNFVNAELDLSHDRATVELIDDDLATLNIEDALVTEGNSGTTELTFNVTLDNPVSSAFNVNFETESSTATAFGDYDPTTGSLTFEGSAGEAQSFTVTVNGDIEVEPDEFLFGRIFNVSAGALNVVIGNSIAIGTILDDDFNLEPTADTQTVSVLEDHSIDINLTGEDGNANVNQVLTFAIVSGPSNGTLFGFNPTTGEVTYTPIEHFHGRDSFTFTVTDDDTLGGPALTSTTATVSITIDSVNDTPTAPIDLNAESNEVMESAIAGSGVGITASSTDIESPSIRYHLSNDAGGRFMIDPTSGVVTVADPSLFGFQTTQIHQISVEAFDAQGGSSSTEFTITEVESPTSTLLNPVEAGQPFLFDPFVTLPPNSFPTLGFLSTEAQSEILIALARQQSSPGIFPTNYGTPPTPQEVQEGATNGESFAASSLGMSLSTIPSKPSNSVFLLGERETLKGLVYRDLNGNGQQDLDEPKVSNEVVLLEQSVEGEDGARFWKLITQTRTNQGGEFRFENVPDGEYRVRLSGSQTELRIRLTSTGTTQTNGESRISENHTPEDGQSAKSANRTLSEQLVDRVMQSFGG